MAVPAWLTRNVFHPLWALKDGSLVRRYMADAERVQFLPAAELEELQWTRLQTLLAHAEASVPYYRDLFRERGLSASDIRSWTDFEALPILTKGILQQEKERLKAERLPDPSDECQLNRTGGSTGEPLEFLSTRRRGELREATTIRHNRWTGWNLGEPMAVIWGAAQDLGGIASLKARLRYALLEKHLTLNTVSMDAARMREFAEQLKRHRPKTWLAYANSSVLFIRFLREQQIDGLSPEAVITSAEMLSEGNRRLIEETLDCRVYDRYGCRELSVIASECGHRADHAMHIAADVLKVEIAASPPGELGAEQGKIIITDLMNFGTPFIRYQIEDISSFAEGSCSCGRALPLLAPVTGRTSDFLVTADGRVVAGTALTILLLAELPGIARGQLLQYERGKVIFRMVPEGDPSVETTREILAACRGALGTDTKVEVEIVEEIPVTASGKFPFAISKVDPFEVLQ